MIIDRLSSKGFSKLELENNTSVNNLIELIVNELKSSYILEMDQNGKQNCLLHGENPILQDDLKKVIKELFSSNPKLTSSQISQILQQKQVDGLELNINRMVSNDGIVNFEYDFPELVFIDKNVIDNNKTQNQINKKSIKTIL